MIKSLHKIKYIYQKVQQTLIATNAREKKGLT